MRSLPSIASLSKSRTTFVFDGSGSLGAVLAPDFFRVHGNIGRRGNPQPDPVAFDRDDSEHHVDVGHEDSFTDLATDTRSR